VHHLRAEKALANLAEQTQAFTCCHLFDLAAVEIQKPQVQDILAVTPLHDELPARPIGNLGVKDFNFDLAIDACHRVAYTRDAGFILISDRQVEREVPFIAKTNLRELLRKR
jgi:hypothetical protein